MKILSIIFKALFLFIIPIVSLLLFQNCGDKPVPKIDCDSTNTAFLPKDFLDRFYFKEGTWWVYKDSLSENRDSVWLGTSSNNISIEPELRQNCIQVASYNYRTNLNYNWLVHLQPVGIAGNKKLSNVRYAITYRNTSKNTDIFRFDFINGSYQNPTEEGGKISFQDSITIQTKVFKDILHLEYLQKPVPAEIIKQAWYAKNYGLVKYESWDGRMWELINYHINQ